VLLGSRNASPGSPLSHLIAYGSMRAHLPGSRNWTLSALDNCDNCAFMGFHTSVLFRDNETWCCRFYPHLIFRSCSPATMLAQAIAGRRARHCAGRPMRRPTHRRWARAGLLSSHARAGDRRRAHSQTFATSQICYQSKCHLYTKLPITQAIGRPASPSAIACFKKYRHRLYFILNQHLDDHQTVLRKSMQTLLLIHNS